MKLSSLSQATAIITLDADLTAASEEALNEYIASAAQQGMKKVVLDFRPVEHMNSGAAGALVKLTTIAKPKGVSLFAYGLGRRYREILKLTNLDRSITVLNGDSEKAAAISQDELAALQKMAVGQGEQSDAGWAPLVDKLHVTERPKGAFAGNMDGRRLLGQLKGFGPMWEKTYWLNITKPGIKKDNVIQAMQAHFVEFQPKENFFYPTSKGIAPGQMIFIDSHTPGGIVSTGVMVLYMDDRSFTFITPQGHPEAGWITFSVDEKQDSVYVQIQGLVRASDPFYELAFTIAGSKFQETIWKHVLGSLAEYLEVENNVQISKYRPAVDLQWGYCGNIWYNAQLRSLPLNITALFRRSGTS